MANRLLVAAFGFAVAMTAISTPAAAAGLSGMTRSIPQARNESFVEANRAALAPFAYVRFCLKNRDKCLPGVGETTVDSTKSSLAKLASINAAINASIVAVSDANGSDQWEVDVAQGDCEDYALTKRERLIAAGYPARALRLAVARTRTGEGHAVLVVRTTTGDLVLDNRTDQIKVWRDTNLEWVKIQSDHNPRLWLQF